MTWQDIEIEDLRARCVKLTELNNSMAKALLAVELMSKEAILEWQEYIEMEKGCFKHQNTPKN